MRNNSLLLASCVLVFGVTSIAICKCNDLDVKDVFNCGVVVEIQAGIKLDRCLPCHLFVFVRVYPRQCPRRFLGINDGDPSVSKSN